MLSFPGQTTMEDFLHTHPAAITYFYTHDSLLSLVLAACSLGVDFCLYFFSLQIAFWLIIPFTPCNNSLNVVLTLHLRKMRLREILNTLLQVRALSLVEGESEHSTLPTQFFTTSGFSNYYSRKAHWVMKCNFPSVSGFKQNLCFYQESVRLWATSAVTLNEHGGGRKLPQSCRFCWNKNLFIERKNGRVQGYHASPETILRSCRSQPTNSRCLIRSSEWDLW